MKLGASLCGAKVTEELFAAYKENGIEYMEITEANNDGGLAMDFSEIKDAAEKYGIKLWSFHLPFTPFSEIDVSADDEQKRKYTVEYMKKIISDVSGIGIDKVIIHPSIEPIADGERQMRMDAAKKTLCELAEFAQSKNVTIAVEDLPRTCLGRNSAEISELISVHDNLRVCFDTNHLLSEPIIDFIKNIGDKIITLHVSDYDFEDERHWLPGEGKIDWKELISGLENIGYDGVWMYEVSLEKYMSKLRETAKKLLVGTKL